jgi:hypothetical protein
VTNDLNLTALPAGGSSQRENKYGLDAKLKLKIQQIELAYLLK